MGGELVELEMGLIVSELFIMCRRTTAGASATCSDIREQY